MSTITPQAIATPEKGRVKLPLIAYPWMRTQRYKMGYSAMQSNYTHSTKDDLNVWLERCIEIGKLADHRVERFILMGLLDGLREKEESSREHKIKPDTYAKLMSMVDPDRSELTEELRTAEESIEDGIEAAKDLIKDCDDDEITVDDAQEAIDSEIIDWVDFGDRSQYFEFTSSYLNYLSVYGKHIITEKQIAAFQSILQGYYPIGHEPEPTEETTTETAVNTVNTMSTKATSSPLAAPAAAGKDKEVVKFADVKIVRDGKHIVLPIGMSYGEGRIWLTRQEEAEEKIITISNSIDCFPLDGAVALRKAMEEIYGFAALSDTPSFFGPRPPVLVQVPLPEEGKFATATLGRMEPPMYEGGFLEARLDAMQMSIVGNIKRKFESEVQSVITRTREILKEDSIYRGQAFMLDLSYIAEGRDFDVVRDAPKFMDVAGLDEKSLILNRATLFALEANIFTLVEQTEACRKNNIPLKHGALLAGPFGTGKTMTARVTASKCVRHGWSFIYLKTPSQFALALKLAEMYSPAVIFCEDVDAITNGNRDAELNNILNTLDGVDTKDKPVIAMLTTNNPDDINPAMLRAGRIDTVVHMTEPDAETAIRFIEVYAKDDDNKSLMEPGSDLTPVGRELAGFVPAFIAEAVQKAKRRAIFRCGTADIVGKVTVQDLLDSAAALHQHREMVNRKRTKSEAEQVKDAAALLNAQ